MSRRVRIQHSGGFGAFPCPICGLGSMVIDSRDACTSLRSINYDRRRRRECPSGHRFTTYESVRDIGSERTVQALRTVASAVRKSAERLDLISEDIISGRISSVDGSIADTNLAVEQAQREGDAARAASRD